MTMWCFVLIVPLNNEKRHGDDVALTGEFGFLNLYFFLKTVQNLSFLLIDLNGCQKLTCLYFCRIGCTSKRCCPILSCGRYRSHYSNRGYQAKSEENWHLREKFGPRAQLCSGEFSSATGGGCAARFVLFKLVRVAVKVMVKEEKLWSMSDVSSPIEVLLNILFLHFLATLDHFCQFYDIS